MKDYHLDGPLLEGPKIQDKAVKPGFILQKRWTNALELMNLPVTQDE